MRDVMIDLETLSTRPDAMIRSIGAVAFGPDGLGAEFSAVISPAGSMGHMDAETVAWWLGQGDAARHPLSAAYTGKREYPASALQRFRSFLNDLPVFVENVRVWGTARRSISRSLSPPSAPAAIRSHGVIAPPATRGRSSNWRTSGSLRRRMRSTTPWATRAPRRTP